MAHHLPSILFATVLLLGCLESTKAALTFTDTRLEINAAPNTKVVTGTYSCKNTGNSPVTITKIRTTCGCTTATASTMVIQPGATAEIPVSMEIRISAGRQEKGVIIETKEAPYRYNLSIAATLPEYVKATPGSLIWVNGDGTKSRIVNLIRNAPDATIGKPRIIDPAFSADVTPTKTGWTLTVSLSDNTKQRFGSIYLPVSANNTSYELNVRLSVIAPAPKKKTSFLKKLLGK